MQVTLLDGVQELVPPTFLALRLIARYGAMVDKTHFETIPTLAALLTDAEELDSRGEPQRIWTPVAVAKQVAPEDIDALTAVVKDYLDEHFPDEEPPKRPTRARAGSNSE